jgi:hypothetical protein
MTLTQRTRGDLCVGQILLQWSVIVFIISNPRYNREGNPNSIEPLHAVCHLCQGMFSIILITNFNCA